MLPAAVVVEIAPKDAASPYAGTLLAACTGAVRVPAGCVVEGKTERVRPAAVAIVSWSDAERRKVRIEVGTESAERSQWVARDISFQPSDQEVERWRSVGLLIASLVGEVLHEPDSSKGETDARPSAPADRDRATPSASVSVASEPPAAERRSSRLDAGFLFGASPVFLGVSLRPARLLGYNWLAAARLDYANQATLPSGFYLTWAAGGLGFGIASAPNVPHVSVDARIEGNIRYLRAAVTLGGMSDHTSQWSFGARLTANAGWMWSSSLGFFVSLSALQMSNGVVIRLRGQTVERLPALSGDACAGVRLALP
jgi:hypothetical protein